MKTPIILTVDDDAEVLRAIFHDIRREYGAQFRVIRVDSGQGALDVTREAKLANEVVALFLADQRMPGMSGVEFLEEAKAYYPDAKRALLTAYADTDAAIKAINDVRLDYYLMKPWDPPEERLYPVLGDLLEDWTAGYRPAFEGIRIVGHRWSSESHDLRDFLARNQVPFQWLDIDADPEATQLLALSGHGGTDLPVVILPDGSAIAQPTLPDIAGRIGLRHTSNTPLYDLIIVGGGPAGLAAAVYGASEGLRTCIVERHAAGGQAGTSSRIENYLGFPSGLSGEDLARRAATQAQRFGAESLLTHEAVRVKPTEGSVGIELSDGSELRGQSIVIATGVTYRLLDAPGIAGLTGRGVYYGAARISASTLGDEDVYISRRRQFGGPGRRPLFRHRPVGDDAGARWVALGQHVVLPDRTDRAGGEHPRPLQQRDRGREWRRPPGNRRDLRLVQQYAGNRVRRGVVHLYRRLPADRLAGR